MFLNIFFVVLLVKGQETVTTLWLKSNNPACQAAALTHAPYNKALNRAMARKLPAGTNPPTGSGKPKRHLSVSDSEEDRPTKQQARTKRKEADPEEDEEGEDEEGEGEEDGQKRKRASKFSNRSLVRAAAESSRRAGSSGRTTSSAAWRKCSTGTSRSARSNLWTLFRPWGKK